MKKIGILLLALCANSAIAQQLAAAHWKGEVGLSKAGVYGRKGENSNAQPGALFFANAWIGNNGLYLFGGNLANSNLGASNDLFLNNRLWIYNKASGWTLVKGDTAEEYIVGDNGSILTTPSFSYGTEGVADANNLPGARYEAAFATAPNGDLYLYGGYGQATDGAGVLSDLWKFDGTNWTWLAGFNTKDQAPVRSTLAQANSTNEPGARRGANLWFDNNGLLHLYGGSHAHYLQNDQNFDDVWTWDGSQWTWIAGTSSFDSAPVQQNGSFTYPRARHEAAGIYASDGYFYMFGGSYDASSSWTATNTFWRFDGASWELLSGDPLIAAPLDATGNTPSGVANASIIEINDSLYITPGVFPSTGIVFEDYYVWRGTTWARIKASGAIAAQLNTFENSNSLGDFAAAAYASNGEEAFIYGGAQPTINYNHSNNVSAMLHGFNGQDFALLDNTPDNSEAQFFTGGPIGPGSRWGSASFYASDEDALYLFGGWGIDESGQYGSLNDLWRYKDNNWVWLSGTKQVGSTGLSGGISQFDATYFPSGKVNPALWKDNGDTLWLSGGLSASSASSQYYSNELWAFYNGQWALMKGSQTQTNGQATYGTKGTPSSSNTPGGRVRSAVWVNAQGDAYIFGGQGVDVNGDIKELNDLWKFNGTDWVWLNGSATGNDEGTPGTNVLNGTNYPSARHDMAFAGNQDGLYIYGGWGRRDGWTTVLDQLWYFDGGTEHWVLLYGTTQGASNNLAAGLNPTKNHSTVHPGLIGNGHLWADGNNLYLFGGVSYSTQQGSNLSHNNLWHWDGSNWAWLGGSKEGVTADQVASRGISLQPDFKNLPSGKSRGTYWSDGSRFFLFGGEGANATGTKNDEYHQDVWVFEKGSVWDGQSWSSGLPDYSDRLVQVVSNTGPGSALECGNLLVDADFQLDMGDKELKLYGDVYNYGDIINISQIEVSSDSIQSIKGNLLEIEKKMIVNAGATLQTNDSLAILATSSSNYGQLVPLGTINGEVEFEYYLTLNSGTDNARYYHFGTVLENVANTSLGDGGYYQTGNASGQLNTLWEWDASSSTWVSPSSGGNLESGKGYALYAGNMNGYNFLLSNGASGKLKLRGTVNNSQAARSINLNYHDGQSGHTFVGGSASSATEGWNLISNPFTHDVDVSSVFSSIGNKTAYFWNGTTYATWNTNTNTQTNGGSSILAPGQGFYIQLPNANSGLSAANLDRGTNWQNAQGSRFKANSGQIDGLKFQLVIADSLRDEAWIGFSPYATDSFDGAFDAWKIMQSRGDFISIESPEGQLAVANYNPQNFGEAIISIASNERHGDSILLKLDLRNLISGSEPVLEDLKTDQLHFLRNDSLVYFVNDTLFDKRFRFYFHRDLGLEEESKQELLFTYNTQGQVFLNVTEPINMNWNVSVFSSDGRRVEELDWDSTQGAKEILKSAPDGVYTISIDSAELKNDFKHSLKVVKCSGL